MGNVIISKAIISYRDISQKVTDESKPIIFWDTCSLLYFNSIIDRRAYEEYEWDSKLLDLIRNNHVYSFTSMVVMKEFNKHHDELKGKDDACENRLKGLMSNYGDIVGSPQKEDLAKGMNALVLSDHMETLITDLWANSIVIDEDLFFAEKAHNRVLADLPPSKEKQEYKDCYIWETFLTLCDNVNQKDKVFFMTENTVDYCGKKSHIPFADITNELNRRGGQLIITKCSLYVEIAKKLGIIS